VRHRFWLGVVGGGAGSWVAFLRGAGSTHGTSWLQLMREVVMDGTSFAWGGGGGRALGTGGARGGVI
jgi:hypothetical protein